MLTYEDCVALSDLTPEEIDAISEHEHIPAVVAAELGNYLLHTEDGIPVLKSMILDDIAAARACGNWQHALELRLVLRHFVRTHPEHAAQKAKNAPPTQDKPAPE